MADSLPPIPSTEATGVKISGVGRAVPERVLTNRDLEGMMDTSDEWITQRTGIRERHVISDPRETTTSLATEAARNAMADAGLAPGDIDFVLVATMTPDMPTPGVSSLVTSNLGLGTIGAVDVNAACSGFVYGMNLAHALISSGAHRRMLVIGADVLTRHVRFNTAGRSTAVLFGDAAGAVVVEASDDPTVGIKAEAMHSDGAGAKHLFVPAALHQLPEGENTDEALVSMVHMNGPAVFRFAVKTFPELIAQTLDQAGLEANDVDHYICHQSNMRILDAARDRFGIDAEKMRINIDRYGNTVAASIPLVFSELKDEGRIEHGQRVMFLGFGAGLTWASSLWQL